MSKSSSSSRSKANQGEPILLVFRSTAPHSDKSERSTRKSRRRWTVEGPLPSSSTGQSSSTKEKSSQSERSPSPITIRLPNTSSQLGKRKRATSPKGKQEKKSKQARNSLENGSGKNGVQQGDEASSTTSSSTPRKKKPMALYKVISNLLKQLVQLDQQSIFYDEVNDDIAPGYSAVITHPMCFTRMRDRLTKRLYTTFDKAQMDLKFVFTNAMAYNTPDTIYYEAAKRMLGEARRLVASYKEKLDPKDLGPTDPLFNDDPPFPMVTEPSKPKTKPVTASPKPRASTQTATPTPTPTPPAQGQPVFQTLVLPNLPPASATGIAAVNQDTSTPKSKGGRPRKKRESTTSLTGSTSALLPKTLLTQSLSTLPPANLPTEPIDVTPHQGRRCLVTVSRGCLPAQKLNLHHPTEMPTTIYRTFSASNKEPPARLQRCFVGVNSNPTRSSRTPIPTPTPATSSSSSSVLLSDHSDHSQDHSCTIARPLHVLNQQQEASNFFTALGTSGDLSWHEPTRIRQRREELQQLVLSVTPLETLTDEDRKQLESLRDLDIPIDFLEPSSSSVCQDIDSALYRRLSLKQQERLDHEPDAEEHYVAHSLSSSLVKACGQLRPVDLISTETVSRTRKLLLEQISRTRSSPA